MGLYSERYWSRKSGVLILLVAFLLIYLPWFAVDQELFRDESILAVGAMEFSPRTLMVTAHGLPDLNTAPLFPFATSLLGKLTGIPFEIVMRGISVFMPEM